MKGFHFIVPSDLGCPVAQNATPALCAPFELMVSKFLQDPNNVASPSQLTNIYWINDGGTVGTGFLKVQGVDWRRATIGIGAISAPGTPASSAPITCTGSFEQTPADAITDAYHQNLAANGGLAQNGVETLPRMRYRARLGWSNGAWSVTGFMNYESHYYPHAIRAAECEPPMHRRRAARSAAERSHA